MRPSDITIVIPTYRRPRLLARALESVLAQRVDGLSVRVFDNDSRDATEAVVQSFARLAEARKFKVEYHCHSENIGSRANIQHAINTTTTPYMAILNDDDMQLPGLAETAILEHERHPASSAFCGLTLVYDDVAARPVKVQGASWAPGHYPAGHGTAQMIREHLTPTGVVFSTRALVDAKFDFSDIEMMARLADANDIVVHDRLTGVFVSHDGSWTTNQSDEERSRLAIQALQGFLGLPSLSISQRERIILDAVRKQAFFQYPIVYEKILAGDRTVETRTALGQSALLKTVLDDSLGLSSSLKAMLKAVVVWKGPTWLLDVLVAASRKVRPPRGGDIQQTNAQSGAVSSAVLDVAAFEARSRRLMPN